MDRCDIAMQNGWPKPEFQTTTGEEIFPDSDTAWWLTELSKRGPTEAPHLEDEDGPWDDDEEEKREELSDDDPLSSEDDATAAGATAEASGVSPSSLPLSTSVASNSSRRTIKYVSNYAC